MFIIELIPPANHNSLAKYYDKISKLLHRTKCVSLASKPSLELSLGGFEKSVQLVKFLRGVQTNFDILFHVTCRDLNKKNITNKLTLLRDLNIDKLLVVSGDDYARSESEELAYENSVELLADIVIHHNWFDTIAVAGYPGGNGRQSRDNTSECRRLSAALELGANVVLTQCIFDVNQFDEFKQMMGKLYENVELIPSVALFSSATHLERIIGLTRVESSSRVLTRLNETLKSLDAPQAEAHCFEYLAELCNDLAKSCTSIELCPFGRFNVAESLIEKLDGH